MGSLDRKYMSDDPPGQFRVGRFGIDALTGLILLNAAVWIVWQFAARSPVLNAFMEEHFLDSPARVFYEYKFHTLLTSTISHISPYHLLGNMLFLWFLGHIVQDYFGGRNLLVLYAACGLAGSLAQVGLDLARHREIPGLGASGAVMGIAVVAAFIEPNRIFNIYGILPLKLWLLVLIFIGLDFSGAMNDSDSIGHCAHLGGAIVGFIFYKFDLHLFSMRRKRSGGLFDWISRWNRRRKFRIIERPREIPLDDREQPVLSAKRASRRRAAAELKESAPVRSSAVDPDTARKVDVLLEKISREGIQALNSEEREFLQQTSSKYRKP